jgi:replicative DNA helicase
MPRDDAALATGGIPPELLTAEAEHGLLGSLLRDNRLYENIANVVTEEHFSYPVHGRIFAAIGSLIAAGTRADPITLKRMAQEDPALTDLGGPKYLVRLAVDVPTLLNAPYYAEQIADAAYRRALADRLQVALQDTLRPSNDRSFAEVIEEHERELGRLHDDSAEERPVVSIDQAVELALQMAEEVYKADGKLTGITTGLHDLDRVLGGLHRTDLVIVAGRPGMGKSALATGFAEAAARAGSRVYFASLEMSADQIAARQMAALGGGSAELQRIGPLSREQMSQLIEAGARLTGLPLHFDDMVLNSVEKLRHRLKRHKRRRGLDMVIVDYLQLMLAERAENRVQEVSAITRGLKAIAKDFQVPVVALSQLSRAVEQRDDKRPMLADLRDSGSIEQDADVVMFLYRDEYYAAQEEPQQREREGAEAFASRVMQWNERCEKAKNKAEILIRKNRHGSTRTVFAQFDAERTLFTSLAWGSPHDRA